MTESTTLPSEPTLQMTEKPTIPLLLNNATPPPEMTEKIPSTVAPVASTKLPYYDKLTTCADFTSFIC